MTNLYWNSLLSLVPSSWIMFVLIYTLGLAAWFFIAMLYLRRREKLLRDIGPLYVPVVIISAIGVVADVFYNWTIGNVIFLSITRDWTISQRLKRYKEDPRYDGTWRERVAISICRELNRQDPNGRHC